MDKETAGTLATEVLEALSEAVVADREFLETTLTGILARGHVLLEDVPGTGKTLTARSFAQVLGLEFSRIQFTPDLLPSDITGSNVYNEAHGEFEFAPGPVFANVILADEINRAPPKTQAALLEAMGERQVTVDGQTHELPEPFVVIATQNPVEQEGTFGLPEAQRDRFIVKTSIGYPDAAGERLLIDRRADRTERMPTVEQVVDAGRVREWQQVPERVTVDPRIRAYIVELGRQTRVDDRVEVGVSPRGTQRLFEAARAAATLDGRDYVVPDDVKQLAAPVFAHRLVLNADASLQGATPETVTADVIGRVEVPAVNPKAEDQRREPNQGTQQSSETSTSQQARQRRTDARSGQGGPGQREQ